MSLMDFAYAVPAVDAQRVSTVIVSDRSGFRADSACDAEEAGFAVHGLRDLHDLVVQNSVPMADIVLVDYAKESTASSAWLAHLDGEIARRRGQLIVHCSPDTLDDAFCYCDQSAAQLLLNASRADVVLAMGQAALAIPGYRVRESDQDNNLLLLRLVEQVTKLATRLEVLAGPHGESELEVLAQLPDGEQRTDMVDYRREKTATPSQITRPPLPDPRLVRSIIRQRQARSRYFDGELFADPAWDMLLDLTAARAEHRRVSVTSLCIASGVPPTTALRWIAQLVAVNVFQRVEDDADRRRAFVALTDKASDAMARYFVEVQQIGARVV